MIQKTTKRNRRSEIYFVSCKPKNKLDNVLYRIWIKKIKISSIKTGKSLKK